jgi:hypothetical protein
VWLALVTWGEYGGGGGGVLRYDRARDGYRRYDIGPAIGQQFAAVGDWLLLGTDHGLFVFGPDGPRWFFVDRTSDGRLRVAEGDLPR